jgi:pimeloyl-ACP methyl ester carboxylesterase
MRHLVLVWFLGLGCVPACSDGHDPVEDAAWPDGEEDGATPGDDGGLEADDGAAPEDDGGLEADDGAAPEDDGGPQADDGAAPEDDGGPQADDGAAPEDDGGQVLLDPAEPGPCAYTSFSAQVASSLDGHAIPVTVYLPGCAGAPYPPAVINHGFQLPASQYTWLAEHLASHAYLAVLNDYPAPAFPGRDHADIARDHADVVAWLVAEGDARLQDRVDGTRVAMLGHSMGGKTGILAALSNPGLVQVLVGLDPVDARTPSVAPELMGGLTVPLLLLGETWSGENGLLGQYCAPLEDNYQQYYQAAPTGLPVLEVTFPQAYHMSWLNNPSCGLTCSACTANPAADHDQVKRLSGRLCAAFLGHSLRGDPTQAHWLWGPGLQAEVDAGRLSFRMK